MKTTKPTDSQPQAVQPLRIESIAQLQAMVDAHVMCRVVLEPSTQMIEIPVQRMSTFTHERRRAWHRKARPPVSKLNPSGVDDNDPKFLEEHERNCRIARSVTVYAHCPLISGQKPGLNDDLKIHEFVNGLFSELILEAIYLKILGGGLQLEEQVNFT